MPGSIIDVQGPIVFFNDFEGTITAVHSIFPGVAENVGVDLGREDDLPGEVRCRMGFQAACLMLPRIYDAMPFFSSPMNGPRLILEQLRKEVPTAISEFTP